MVYLNLLFVLTSKVGKVGRSIFFTSKQRVDSKHIMSVFVFMFCIFIILSCAKKPSSDFDKGLEFYRQNKLEEACSLFESAAEQDKNDPDVYTWLAETYRRLRQTDTAFATAKKAIEIDSCHCFAHTVLAYIFNPMYSSWEKANKDSTWSHLLRAIACDSTDGNVWLAIWTESIYRGDKNLEKKALSSLIKTGFLTPAVLSYNRWMLRYVPQKAILLTNGDMDTYPAVAVQEVESYRPDVAVVNYSLLNTPWYARFVRDKYDIQLPVADSQLDSLRAYQDENGNVITVANQIMKGWLKMRQSGTLDNPIAIAVTVGDLSFAEDTQDHLKLAGAFHLWLPEPSKSPLDTSMIRTSLAGINPDDFTGPFVSAKDYSSVRISSSNRIVANITDLALSYCKALLESKRASEAFKMLTWAEQFEHKTELGPIFTEDIEQLKKIAQQQMKEQDRSN